MSFSLSSNVESCEFEIFRVTTPKYQNSKFRTTRLDCFKSKISVNIPGVRSKTVFSFELRDAEKTSHTDLGPTDQLQLQAEPFHTVQRQSVERLDRASGYVLYIVSSSGAVCFTPELISQVLRRD